MIPVPPVGATSAIRSCVLALVVFAFAASALALGGCAALLPPYNVPDPPLPAAALEADETFTMPDGAVLPVRTWLPPGPASATSSSGTASGGAAPRAVMLALHGFNDSRDQWELVGPVLAGGGVALFAPDLRGFGAAPGRGAWPGSGVLRSDAAAMLRLLRARYPGVPLYAMGESMGGALLMTLAAGPDAPAVDGWILLAPAVWGRAQMGVLLSTGLWLVSNVAPDLRVTGTEVPIRVVASDNREALLRLARNPLTIRRTRFGALRGLVDLMDEAQAAAPRMAGPALVLYGERDELVPRDAMVGLWRVLPAGARRALYPAGYHLLLRDRTRAAPIGDILAWMADREGWLPSGADAAAAAWQAARH